MSRRATLPAGTALALAAALAAGQAAAADPAPDAAPAGEQFRADLERADADVQAGLGAMAAAVQDFEAERRKWAALDRSVAAAKRVNAALAARNKIVLDIYDTQLTGALARYKVKLKAAPPLYRRLSADRSRLAAEATLDLERRSYRAMAELCEAAAVLCERRYEELFAETGPARVSALDETVKNMRVFAVVHKRWAEVLDAYPSALEDRNLSALFDNQSAYAEDLQAFTTGVEKLKDAMKRKAAGGSDGGGRGAAPVVKDEPRAEAGGWIRGSVAGQPDPLAPQGGWRVQGQPVRPTPAGYVVTPQARNAGRMVVYR